MQAAVGYRADFAVFQGNGVADMVFGGDGIEAEHVTRHPEISHHALAFDGVEAGLQAAAAHRIERGQWVIGIEQCCALANPHAWPYQGAQAAVVVKGQAGGQAQAADAALLAHGRQRSQVNRIGRGRCIGVVEQHDLQLPGHRQASFAHRRSADPLRGGQLASLSNEWGGVEAGKQALDELFGLSGRGEAYPAVIQAYPPAVVFGVVFDVDVHWSLQSLHEQDNCVAVQNEGVPADSGALLRA